MKKSLSIFYNMLCTLPSLLFLIVSTILLEAKIEDHFKKCGGKLNNHKMKNIDFIYLINLDQREEKLQNCLEQLNPFGIYPYRFSAVNGWELTLEQINDVGLKFAPGMKKGIMATSYLTEDFSPTHNETSKHGQTYFCHCTARGTIGIFLSHASILQDAYDSGYETIWVMEDDIEVMQDPTKISKRIKQLDKCVGKDNWDILFTDKDIRNAHGKYESCDAAAKLPDFRPKKTNDYAKRKKVGKHFLEVGARFGCTSMIYRRSGIKKVLKFIKKHSMFLPIDMTYILPKDIKIYSLRKDIVTNLTGSLSDNGVEGYLNKKK